MFILLRVSVSYIINHLNSGSQTIIDEVTLQVCLHILVYVVADFADVLARTIMCDCRHHNDIIHRIKSICLDGKDLGEQ